MRRSRLTGYYKVARLQMRGPEAFPLHDHEFGEIFWIDDKSCDHYCNGGFSLLEQGDCCFLRPWDAHSLHCPAGESFHLFNIAFSWDSLMHVQGRYFPQSEDPYGIHRWQHRQERLSKYSLNFCRQSALRLLDGEPSLLKLERFLVDVLAHFSRPLPAIGEFKELPPLWLQQGCQEMKRLENLRGGVARLVELCGRSAAHVSREFKRCYGKTPQLWVDRLRMNYAATQLAGTAKDILDICWDCGYESVSHFYVRFRRFHKVSPARYRRELRQRVYSVES